MIIIYVNVGKPGKELNYSAEGGQGSAFRERKAGTGIAGLEDPFILSDPQSKGDCPFVLFSFGPVFICGCSNISRLYFFTSSPRPQSTLIFVCSGAHV